MVIDKESNLAIYEYSKNRFREISYQSKFRFQNYVKSIENFNILSYLIVQFKNNNIKELILD